MIKAFSIATLLGLIILLYLESTFGDEIQGCVLLKTDVNEYSKELETRIIMERNRILPFRKYDSNNQTVEVLYKNFWIRLPTKYTKMGGKGLCSPEPKCVVSTGVTSLRKNADVQSPKIGFVYEDQKLPFLGKQMINGKIWIQVDLGDKIGWVENEKVKIENKACGLSKVGKSAWSFEVETGAFTSKKVNEFQNVFFYSNNQDLSTANDPIYHVQSITHQIASLSAVYEKNKQGVSAGIGFIQRGWQFKKYSNFRYTNPLPPNNCLVDTPIESTDSYKESFILFPVSYRYQVYEKQNHRLRIRPQLFMLMSIETKFPYKHRTPCNVEINGIEKSNLFQAHGIFNLDYLYSFKRYDLGFSLGLENTSGTYLSLLIGF